MKKYHLLILLSVLICGCSGNQENGQVSISCLNVNEFESEQGIINIGSKSLGDVFLVDTAEKYVAKLGSLDIEPSLTTQSTLRDSVITLSNTKFDIQFTGDVSVASTEVKEKIESQIRNQTTFFLSNSFRRDIKLPISYFIHAAERNPDDFVEPLKDKPNVIAAFVFSITYADRFEFRLKKISDLNADVNTLKFGNYKLSVNYSCDNSLNIHAKKDGVFYKVLLFSLDSNKFKLFTKPVHINTFEMIENALH